MKHFQSLLDSGAFSVNSKGKTIDIEKYAQFAIQHRDLFKAGTFNLDVINPATSTTTTDSAPQSYENWLTLKKLGVDSIPVYHIGESTEYLVKYLDQTDYIGIGAIAKLDTNSRLVGLDHVWDKYLRDSEGKPRCRIHGLGLTNNSIMLRYQWFSVDSTRAVALAAYGSILVPKISVDGGVDYESLRQIAVSDQTRKVEVGGSTSFFSLPNLSQSLIRVYCSNLGYEIAKSLDGRALRPHAMNRKRKDPIVIKGLDIPSDVSDDVVIDSKLSNGHISFENKNLSESWMARYVLNLFVTDQFVYHWRTKGKTLRIYNVIGGAGPNSVWGVFSKGVQTKPAARALFSYARLNDSFVRAIRDVVDGNK